VAQAFSLCVFSLTLTSSLPFYVCRVYNGFSWLHCRIEFQIENEEKGFRIFVNENAHLRASKQQLSPLPGAVSQSGAPPKNKGAE